jgi:hypothetical protein
MPVKPNQHNKTSDQVILPPSDIPLPLECKYGGLGGVIKPVAHSILIGDGNRFKTLETPLVEHHFLTSGEEGLRWSKFKLEILGDAKLDQSLHKKSVPVFAGLGIRAESGGASWLRRQDSKHDYTITLMGNCLINQDLSKGAAVAFESVSAEHINVDLVKLRETDADAKKVGAGVIAMRKEGAFMSNGEVWMSLHGNIHGGGKAGRLAYFDGDISIKSCTSLQYINGFLGIGVDEPRAMLHVKNQAIFEQGINVGELKPEESYEGSFGLINYKPVIILKDGCYFLGTGNGDISGEGEKGRLAYFDGKKSIKSSTVGISSSGALLCKHIISDEAISNSLELINGDKKLKLITQNSKLYANDIEMGAAFKRGKIKCDFGEIIGNGYTVDEDISIKATIASGQNKGIASFEEIDFGVKNGHVAINWNKAPHAKNGYGLISDKDYEYFRQKAPAFTVGEIREGTGINIGGSGKAFGGDLNISMALGTYTTAGALCVREEDFIIQDGVVCLRYKNINTTWLNEMFSSKQDTLVTADVSCGVGFAAGYAFKIMGSKDIKIDLAMAGYDDKGVCSFNDEHFYIADGHVHLKALPVATQSQNGLMSTGHVKMLSNTAETVLKCPQGYGQEGYLALWTKEGLRIAGDFVPTNSGIEYKKQFNAEILRTSSVLILGTTEMAAEKMGAGVLRYENGCLEVSNGVQWITLRAGGVIGEGKTGSLSFWATESTLSASESLFWDEESQRLGIGTAKPSHHIQIEKSGAGIALIDTRPSSPQAGSTIMLSSVDGSVFGQSDTLGRIIFSGAKNFGSSIRAYAAANWTSLSAPTALAFGTTPDGQISPIEHMFLTQLGYLGVGIALPAVPLHIAAQNKNSMSAIFEGGVRIGKCDASANSVGKGSLKFENGRLFVSDGISWRALVLEA